MTRLCRASQLSGCSVPQTVSPLHLVSACASLAPWAIPTSVGTAAQLGGYYRAGGPRKNAAPSYHLAKSCTLSRSVSSLLRRGCGYSTSFDCKRRSQSVPRMETSRYTNPESQYYGVRATGMIKRMMFPLEVKQNGNKMDIITCNLFNEWNAYY